MNDRPTVTIITALVLCLGLGACSSGSASSSVAAAAAGRSDSSTPTAALATASPPSPTSGTTSPAATSPGTTGAAGHCSLIDQPAAETILGFTTKPGLSSPGGGSAQLKKLDDCVYQNLASGSLGYTVAKVDTQIGVAMISAIKARMSGAGTQVSVFDAGMANSIGFTQKLPLGVDSQITVLVGDRLISVASTRKDSNVATSRASAIAAAQKLATSA
jgi:hypothetical protein